MSFAGHAGDMIRRDKENRALRKQARESSKNARSKSVLKGESSEVPPISLEEFERVNRELKERDVKEKRYYFRVLTLFLVAGSVIIAILWLLKIR